MRTYVLSETPVNGIGTLVLLRMQNSQGLSVDVTNWGASLVSAIVPDRKGVYGNILLGYNDITDYVRDSYYLGAIIGPFANRIHNACFQIGEETFRLDRNDGMNTNHSGAACIGRKCWHYELTPEGICFSILSPHLSGGYPGNIQIKVYYTLTDDNELHITYWAETDRKTYVNLTNHAYFNLGNATEKITGHLLQIHSLEMVETDSAFIPTGKIVNVKESPFDFSKIHRIGQDLYDKTNQQLVWNKGYNHCYTFHNPEKELVCVATLLHPGNGRRMDVFTDYPGMLLYTAGYYRNPDTGICFEAQYFPDTPSHKEFPSCLLSPGENYCHKTVFKFSIN